MRTRPSRVRAGVVGQPARADQHAVAGAQELGVALGQLQAQDVFVLRQRRDGLARHDDASDRDGHAQHAARGGREDGAFGRLLRDHLAVALHRGQVAFGDLEIGLGLVGLRLRRYAAPREIGDAVEIGLGLVALRLQRGDARIERLHLQGELGVGDLRDHGAGGHVVALLDRQRGDGAADPRARDQLVDGLDGGDDGLAVGDLRLAHDEGIGDRRGGGEEKEEREASHQTGCLRLRLDVYIRIL